MKTEVTREVNEDRGLASNQFRDCNNQLCGVQDSSSGSEPRIWVGLEEDTPPDFLPNEQTVGKYGRGWRPVELVPNETEGHLLFHNRMHINQEQAKALIKLLQRFVKYGSV